MMAIGSFDWLAQMVSYVQVHMAGRTLVAMLFTKTFSTEVEQTKEGQTLQNLKISQVRLDLHSLIDLLQV